MPVLPWIAGTHQPSEQDSLHVFTSRLPLRRYRDVPRFLVWTWRIGDQLRKTDGCVGFTLDAHLFSKTFATLSAWSDPDTMNHFVRSGAHAAMLADMAGRMGRPTFVGSAATAGDIPLDWTAARARLAEHEE
ncbi:hypothetical protein [Nocardia sp. NPDC046763]|uniref:hypothetical protein n=1 Tax=Nocardia sp. NPDC046763 TaxID=3155256 RepID=UPI0033C1124B